jgi:excisionase family DNA binding protein
MRLLTYKDLSRDLSLSVRYLQECVKHQNLPCIQFGRVIRFDPEQIVEWVKNRNQKADNPEIEEAV